MNELVIGDRVDIPLVQRPLVQAMSNKLRAPMSGWSLNPWMLQDWYREA